LWAVESSGWIVGFTGASRPLWFPAYEHEVELGWRLHPAARGHGFATEAAREALQVVFAHLAVDRVISCIDPTNAASIAVAERLGMTLDVTVNHPQRAGELHIYERVNSR
jgi:RimJ/RimL family protein N-acetyltransferase